MSDNDLIKRGRMREEIKKLTFNPLVNELLYKVLDAIPREQVAADHVMTASELFSAYQRMCEEYSRKGTIRCDECPVYSVCPEIGHSLRVMNIWAYVIERWAEKHREERSE